MCPLWQHEPERLVKLDAAIENNVLREATVVAGGSATGREIA